MATRRSFEGGEGSNIMAALVTVVILLAFWTVELEEASDMVLCAERARETGKEVQQVVIETIRKNII